MRPVNWAVPHTSFAQLDLDGGSQAQAGGWLYRDVLATDLIPIQSQRPELGEVGHIHNAAETTQSEL